MSLLSLLSHLRILSLLRRLVLLVLWRLQQINFILVNSLKEGQRLQKEVDELQSYEIGDVKINYKALPTLVDGKVKSTWTGTSAYR